MKRKFPIFDSNWIRLIGDFFICKKKKKKEKSIRKPQIAIYSCSDGDSIAIFISIVKRRFIIKGRVDKMQWFQYVLPTGNDWFVICLWTFYPEFRLLLKDIDALWRRLPVSFQFQWKQFIHKPITFQSVYCLKYIKILHFIPI